MVTREFLFDYLKQHRLAVIATVNAHGDPESALVGFAVTENLEIVFDTVTSSRKYPNLETHPQVALVIGWNDISTVQFEGVARQLGGVEDDHYRATYYAAYPDGPDRTANWPDLVHFVVKPTWVRYSSFGEVLVKEELRF